MTHPARPVIPLALSTSNTAIPYLSLGMIAAFLRSYKNGALGKRYQVHKVVAAGFPGRPLAQAYQSVARGAVVLLSSYVWNHELNMKAAKQLKKRDPSVTIVIGGPEIPKWDGEGEAFLAAHPAIDIAVLGEGEVACAELLDCIAQCDPGQVNIGTIPGILFRHQGEIVRTAERERIKDLEMLPSPYLEGEFDQWISEVPTATLETNRGCPYGCTYCDWGSATLQKVSRFSHGRVDREIDYLAINKMESIFIADANFGMLEQDIGIAQALVQARKKYGFPRRLYTNFAKNGGRRLMTVIDILHAGGLLPTGIIALQTTDENTLKTIERDNIRTASYEKMMHFFSAKKIPMASDLMIGLPGQTVDSFVEDLQFCFDWKVSAHGNYTSMMPNAPMAEASYRQAHAIIADDNNMIASTATFSADELIQMRTIYLCYLLMVRMSLLRYFLYFLQLDYGVSALGFLQRWLELSTSDDALYPISHRICRDILEPAARQGHWAHVTWDESAEFLFADLNPFFEEVCRILADEFAVQLTHSERQAIFSAQAAVMPKKGGLYPMSVILQHDVPGYFSQLEDIASLRADNLGTTPLREWPQGLLSTGEAGLSIDSISMTEMLGHSDSGWELSSPLRFY